MMNKSHKVMINLTCELHPDSFGTSCAK